LFSARGYNIYSLSVGETQDAEVSCITLVVEAPDEKILEQIKKQLHKLIDVITVVDLTRRGYVDRDLILAKVNKDEKIGEVLSKYMIKVLLETDEYYLLEICTERQHEEEIIKDLEKIGIQELVRTGRIAISK
jgi:acetolactate synthase-1/3 small subunit